MPMKQRCNAILLHLSSLPSPFGIGVMGEEALDFAKRLAEAGVSYWQILPLTYPLEDSPYQSLSAFAGNPAFIDPRDLVDRGLLLASELEQFKANAKSDYQVDFAFVHENAKRYLKTAFLRLGPTQQQALEAFLEEQPWLDDFALYIIAKEKNDLKAPYDWSDAALRHRDPEALAQLRAENAKDYWYHIFVQWLFFEQWRTLKNKINEMGVGIFGDIPFYVATDSVESWVNPDLFAVDQDLRPTWLAGVPPDYFAVDGQLWGNAIYNWSAMQQEQYAWWIDRIAASLELYDLLRIDHFRGFSSYWAVPAGEKTARGGHWEQGPGMDLFRALAASPKIKTSGHDLPIVAEDLGDIDDDVRLFLQESGFPGMKVLQFAFDETYRGKGLPHSWTEHCCAYTGTHDNNTLFAWLYEASEETRAFALAYAGLPAEVDWREGGAKSPACRAIIKSLLASVAKMTVVPMQDLLGYGADTRMNCPGISEGQWRFRLGPGALEQADFAWLTEQNRLYQRATDYRLVYIEDEALDAERKRLGLVLLTETELTETMGEAPLTVESAVPVATLSEALLERLEREDEE